MYLINIRHLFFFFNDTATTEIYTLSLHDALPIWTSFAVFSVDPPASSRISFMSGGGFVVASAPSPLPHARPIACRVSNVSGGAPAETFRATRTLSGIARPSTPKRRMRRRCAPPGDFLEGEERERQ